MSSLESLVPSLDLCRQLQALGFPQDTAMVWVGLWGVDGHWHVQSRESIEMLRAQPELDRVENGATLEDRGLVTLSAPTAGELDDWLMCNDCDNILVTNETADGENAVGVSCIHSDGRDFEAHEATEIEAKAALVLEVAR